MPPDVRAESLMVNGCADVLDGESKATSESSMTKGAVSNVLCRVAHCFDERATWHLLAGLGFMIASC